jgi:Ca2+-binding EF-hand superfamily protein
MKHLKLPMTTATTRRPAARVGAALIGLAVMTVAAAAPAAAGPGPGGGAGEARERSPFPMVIADVQARAEQRFAALDTDGDGKISLEEFSTGKASATGRKSGRGSCERDQADQETDLFKRLDSDGDGKLTPAEFNLQALRGHQRSLRLERMFTRLDTNADGVLGGDEMSARVDRLHAMDADGNGTVTREEARAYHQAQRGRAD